MESILNQLVYFGFLQSIFLLFIYTCSPKNRNHINGYIAFLIAVLMIGLVGRVLYISEIFGKDFRFIALSEFATLFFGSTVYLFTRSSLLQIDFSKKELIHFVPGIFYIVMIVLVFMIPSSYPFSIDIKLENLFLTISLFMGFGLVFNITYWILSFRTFLLFKKKLKNELSFSVKTQFFQNFLMAIGLCLISWVLVYFIGIFGNDQMLERNARQFIWLSIAFIVLFIAYYGMKEPDLFKITTLVNNQKYAQSKLSKSDLNDLKIKLDQLMVEKKPYLNRKLLKAELAEMLGVSNPEIARLLNENIGMNFFEYINYYRIKEFVQLAKTDKAQKLTFFGIAQEAGFNSKTTFNKSFKELMGTSPKEYFSNNSI